MTHPLENYRVIANISYITGIEDKLYIDRYLEVNNIADAVEREKDKDRLKITIISDVWGEVNL